jgi:transcriptional regulator with XRE-family HTH domain
MKQKTSPFSTALTQMIRVKKRCTQEALGKAVGYKQSTISAMMQGDRDGKETKRRSIADYFGYDYESFLQLGQDLIEQEDDPTSTTKHRSIKPTNIEIHKEETEKMDQDVMKILQDHIETLKQNNERERQEHRDTMERERQAHERAMADLRADLERERQAHERTLTELREDYKELKLENKQLLEQHRALQQKKAQPSQSPDKPEEKKAVNQ